MQSSPLAVATPGNPHTSPIKHRISSKVRIAVDAMVFEGLDRATAAQAAGLKDNSLYIAFRNPEVKRYWRQQLDVLRESEEARNIHALLSVRDQTGNQAARVAAVNSLTGQRESATATGIHRSAPGVTIIINGNAPVQAIEHQPVTIDNDPA